MTKKILIGLTLALLGAANLQALDLPTDTADVIMNLKDLPNGVSPTVEATGDFNGDGFKDIVLSWRYSPTGSTPGFKAIFIPGGPSLSGGAAMDRAALELYSPNKPPTELRMGDVDQDGRDDVLLLTRETNLYRVEIYYGRNPWPPSIDLHLTPPDWTVITPLGVSFLSTFDLDVGDANGDGWVDLVMGGSPGLSRPEKAFLLPGRSGRQTGVLDLETAPGVTTFLMPGTPRLSKLRMANFNQDGRRDLLFHTNGTLAKGVAYVVWGSSTLPALWDFSTRHADVTLVGYESLFTPEWAGDVDGDGVDELYAANAFVDPQNPLYDTIDVLVPGSNFNAGASTISFQRTSPYFQPVVEVVVTDGIGWMVDKGDFDGEGKTDIVYLSTSSVTHLWLSSDIPSLAVAALPGPSLTVPSIYGNPIGLSMGDVNGDGADDLVMLESGSTGTCWVTVIYGFRPLDNPVIHFRERGPSPVERTVELTVEGDPVEMRFDGDGDPGLMNRWIPYERAMRLGLAPGEGTRTVGVTFRNRYKRESARVEDTLTLGGGRGGDASLDDGVEAGRTAGACGVRVGGERANPSAGV